MSPNLAEYISYVNTICVTPYIRYTINTYLNICQICQNMSWIIYVRQTAWYCVYINYDSFVTSIILSTRLMICDLKSPSLIFNLASSFLALILSLIFSFMQAHRYQQIGPISEQHIGRYWALTKFEKVWLTFILRWLEVNACINVTKFGRIYLLCKYHTRDFIYSL